MWRMFYYHGGYHLQNLDTKQVWVIDSLDFTRATGALDIDGVIRNLFRIRDKWKSVELDDRDWVIINNQTKPSFSYLPETFEEPKL